jgi:hypothetical protein
MIMDIITNTTNETEQNGYFNIVSAPWYRMDMSSLHRHAGTAWICQHHMDMSVPHGHINTALHHDNQNTPTIWATNHNMHYI